MTPAVDIILAVFRDTWGLLVTVISALIILGLLVQVLKGTSAYMFGSSPAASQAVISSAGLVLVALTGFYVIPALAHSVVITAPSCGPVSRLGEIAAVLISVTGALRMLLAVLNTVAISAAGAPQNAGTTIAEIGIVLFGMLLATVAVPVATAFFGVC